MGAPAQVPKGKEKLVTVPAPLAEDYAWLGSMKANLKTEAENRERKLRATEVVPETADVLSRRYRRLAKRQDTLKIRISNVRGWLQTLWAQQGLAEAEGITVSPILGLQLPQDAILAELAPEVVAQVIRSVPVLDVEMLMALVDVGKVPQEIIGKHLRGEFDIQVRRSDN